MATLRTLTNGTKADAGDCNFNFNALNNESAVIENTVSGHTTSIGTLNSSVTSLQSSVSTISSSISGGALVPIGTIVWFAKNTAPSGYLICNGSAVNRTDYADLYAKIGTTFGSGDGSTTFNVPNLINKVIKGNTTLNSADTSIESTASSVQHKHGINIYGAGAGYTETNDATANHSHWSTIPTVTLLPCIKY